MRWIWFAICLICSPAHGQTLQTLGAGSAASVATSAYTGPGDVKSGAFAWGSCARAYTSAFAATLAAICDVVDTSTGLVTCTFHIQASGFVSPSECNATACATACSVTKVYDQTGNGHHFTQATLSAMPLVEFAALGGLPGMKCASTGTSCLVASAAASLANPINISGVFKRAGANTTNQGYIGCTNGGSSPRVGTTTSTNTIEVNNSGTSLTGTGADGSYHSVNATNNGASSALNIDGSDASTGTLPTNGCITEAFRIHRATNQSQGTIMEAGWWGTPGWSGTDRNNVSANQHSAANGYNF